LKTETFTILANKRAKLQTIRINNGSLNRILTPRLTCCFHAALLYNCLCPLAPKISDPLNFFGGHLGRADVKLFKGRKFHRVVDSFVKCLMKTE